MNKSTKRRITDRKKTEAVHWVAKQYDCTTAYVYGVLNGTYSNNGRAEDILKAYREKYAELQQVLS